jgi:hypothetical protein
VSGHFGEFIQGRFDPNGPLVLITVPNANRKVRVEYAPGPFKVEQNGTRSYPKEVVSKIFSVLNHAHEGQFKVNIDMPEGCGLGSSTAARIAFLLSINPDLSPEFLAQSCIADEGASDPIMFSKPEKLLWAPRQGKIIRTLPKLPKITCIGGLYGVPQRTDPNDLNFPIITDLIREWEFPNKTPTDLGEICSESSKRTLKLKGHTNDPTRALSKDLGALGYSIAHTGSVRNFIFPYNAVPNKAKKHLQKAGFTHVQEFSLGLS